MLAGLEPGGRGTRGGAGRAPPVSWTRLPDNETGSQGKKKEKKNMADLRLLGHFFSGKERGSEKGGR